MNSDNKPNHLFKQKLTGITIAEDANYTKINFKPMIWDHILAFIICTVATVLFVYLFYMECIQSDDDEFYYIICFIIFALKGIYDAYKLIKCINTEVEILHENNQLSISAKDERTLYIPTENPQIVQNYIEIKSIRKGDSINGFQRFNLIIRYNDPLGVPDDTSLNETTIYGLNKSQLDWLISVFRYYFDLPTIERSGSFLEWIRKIKYYTPEHTSQDLDSFYQN